MNIILYFGLVILDAEKGCIKQLESAESNNPTCVLKKCELDLDFNELLCLFLIKIVKHDLSWLFILFV